jgi:hypothetical protein
VQYIELAMTTSADKGEVLDKEAIQHIIEAQIKQTDEILI